MSGEEAKTKRKAQGERYTRIMWAYVCGGIALVSQAVGLGGSLIPPGFAILGGILAWQLFHTEDQRHGLYAGIIDLGGLMIWLTGNAANIHRYLAG